MREPASILDNTNGQLGGASVMIYYAQMALLNYEIQPRMLLC